MFIFVTCDVSPFAGFAWFLARAVLKMNHFQVQEDCLCIHSFCMQQVSHHKMLLIPSYYYTYKSFRLL